MELKEIVSEIGSGALISARQAGIILGIKPEYVLRLRRMGKLKGIIWSGRAWLQKESVDQFHSIPRQLGRPRLKTVFCKNGKEDTNGKPNESGLGVAASPPEPGTVSPLPAKAPS